MKKDFSAKTHRRQEMNFYKYAGFWRRFIAYMIDGFIISIVLIMLMFIAGIAFFAGTMSRGSNAWMTEISNPELMVSYTLWIWVFSTMINIMYFTYFHGSTGRTPGKMLLGLQVVSVDGNRISFGIAFLRSVGYLISSIFFCLGFIWIGFDKKKQGWHDKIAGTVVIIREKEDHRAGISIADSATSTIASQQPKPPENNDN
jgi:uncharacterized RDD family membrane protein YckC